MKEIRQHFDDQVHYQKINESMHTVKEKIEHQYKILQLDSKIKGRKTWNIGIASLLPKNKDINKFKPLVSYAKFYSRTFGQLASRALTVIIKTLKQRWMTMELMRTKDFVGEVGKFTAGSKWKRTLKKDITLIKWDIKNQFTNLPKQKVINALDIALNFIQNQTSKKGVTLRRREAERHSDKLGTGSPRTWINISFQELMRYVIMELDTPYIKVGAQIYKQIEGLPMGGYLSAGLAVIYSMYREHTNFKLWKQLEMKSKWFRFRDDILAIVEGRLKSKQISNIQIALKQVYGIELTVELEETSNQKI
ncbi:MAG: hypothetical protein ACREA8_09200 [Nitrosotalea sp.]